jgi:predicted transglutaminase-like cysteine proteinase
MDAVPTTGIPMATGTPAAPPFGFAGFCAKYPAECAGAVSAPVIVALSDTRRRQLDRVQGGVNEQVAPVDIAEHGWDYPTGGYGDCNQYALEKRRALIALGWPRGALLLASAITETGEGHLVLVARTSAGDLVLDNRRAAVVDWRTLPYHWLSRQSAAHPGDWVSLLGRPTATAVASNLPARQSIVAP